MPVINSLIVKREGGGGSDSLLPIPADSPTIVRCWDVLNMSNESTGALCGTASYDPQPDELVYFYCYNQEFEGYKPLPGLSVRLWTEGPVVPFIGWIKVSRYDPENATIYFKVDNLGEIPYLYGTEV